MKFTYRSTCGEDIEDDFNGNVKKLLDDFRHSVTPVSSINGIPQDLTDFLTEELVGAELALNEQKAYCVKLREEIKSRKKKLNTIKV